MNESGKNSKLKAHLPNENAKSRGMFCKRSRKQSAVMVVSSLWMMVQSSKPCIANENQQGHGRSSQLIMIYFSNFRGKIIPHMFVVGEWPLKQSRTNKEISGLMHDPFWDW